MKHNTTQWFTLIELLVTMTIFVILATISYIYVDTNIAESNDAKRFTDLNQVETSLENYFTKNGEYPDPDNMAEMTYSGTHLAWKQWTFWKEASKALKTYGAEYPRDEKYDTDYAYSVTNRNREFQLASIRQVIDQEDEEELWKIVQNILVPEAQAAKVETAHVVGNYNGFMVRAEHDSNDQVYFIASPSILSYDINETDVKKIITDQKLVFHKFFNIPHVYESKVKLDGWFNFAVSNPLLYSGNTNDLKQEQTLLDFNDTLKFIYATTPTESFDTYLNILEEESLIKLKKFLTKTFKIPFRSYFNCKDILDDNASDGDGIYTISPNADGSDSYEVFCDMTTDWWGWTRIWDNHITNGDFASGTWVVWAVEVYGDSHSIEDLNWQLPDELRYALHQIWNYSTHYKMQFDDPSVLKQWYEVRMTTWRSDQWSWWEEKKEVTIMWWKKNPWTISNCTSYHSTNPWCQMYKLNKKLLHEPNFWTGWLVSDIEVNIKDPVDTITSEYLDGWILFDGFIPNADSNANGGIDTYTLAEIEAIDNWVLAGGFLISTNDVSTWSPLWQRYGYNTAQVNQNWEQWNVENVDHPIVNGSIWLKKDLRWETLYWQYRHSWLVDNNSPDVDTSGDIIISREARWQKLPTMILRKHGKGHILLTSGDWFFKDVSNTNTFEWQDNESVFVSNIITYWIETAAWINPKEWYPFHNRIYYEDGTFSSNGKDEKLETVEINGNAWTKERTRHKILKKPLSNSSNSTPAFVWELGRDANNNKDLYFTGLRLELFYR